MATSKTFNGTTYSIPAVGERLWGTNVRNFLISVADNALAKSGGNFTLTAELNFGATYGVVSAYLKSRSSNISTTGILRLANNEGIGWRNAANNADQILKLDAGNRLELDGVDIPTISSTDTFTNKSMSGASNTFTNIPASGLASTTGSGAVVLASGATLTSPAITTPTGIVKGDVGLGNVDNTSDATKNAASVTLTNKTIVTPVIDDYLELNEESAPSTPSSGKVRVYAKTDKKIYTKDSAGTELQVGASGSGEINAITTGSTDATGWSGASTDTSNSPLSPVTTTSIAIANSATSESSTSGGYKTFTLPTGLQNKKLKVEFYFTTPATDVYAVSVYKSTTRVPLSTDSSSVTTLPASTTGKFTAYFDTDTTSGWTVSITRTSGSTGTCYVTSMIVGPGIQPQGAVVGPWRTDWTPTGTWSTNTTYTGRYRQVGDTAEVNVKVLLSGAPDATTLKVNLPSGLTIDTTKLADGSSLDSLHNVIGTTSILDSGTTAYSHAQVIPATTTSVRPTYIASLSNATNISNTAPMTFASGDIVDLIFQVPIAEWAGSGTVNLAQNDVEYASVSGTWDSSTSTTVYGPAGQVMGGALTFARTKTLTWQRPVQQGDQVSVEASFDGSTWFQASSNYPRVNDSTGNDDASAGLWVQSQTSTQTVVQFNRYANIGNDDTPAVNWPSTLYWRVRKSSAGAAVGFGIVQPGVSSGLVSASGLPGNTTGSAIASGYVGETQVATGSTTGTLSSGTITQAHTLTLGPGVWSISGYVAFSVSGGDSTTEKLFASGISNATATLDEKYFDIRYSKGLNLVGYRHMIPARVYSISTSTVFYLNIRQTAVAGTAGTTTGGDPTIFATRIA